MGSAGGGEDIQQIATKYCEKRGEMMYTGRKYSEYQNITTYAAAAEDIN